MQKKILQIIEAVEQKRPVLKRIIEEHGALNLASYTSSFRKKWQESLNDPADVIAIATDMARESLGERVANQLAKTLKESPDILTANHFGPLNLSFTTQGNILYALSKKQGEVVPVFGCSAIPLNNQNYARGLICADGVKINIFPTAFYSTLVSQAPLVTKSMLQNARKQLSGPKKDAIEKILGTYENNLDAPTYSIQTTRANAEIWNLLFTEEMPPLVFLELEKITAKLLEKDLLDFPLFFDPALRSSLIKTLNGQVGCWNIELLKTQSIGCGTMFFWGIDGKGRRMPLVLTEEKLVGNSIEIPFTPDGVIRALQEKKIIPNLFTCFTAVAFMRGFVCYGGFMQADYLTLMRDGLAKVLGKEIEVPTENFVTGLIFAVEFDEIYREAGAIEIITYGGLTKEMMEKIKKMRVYDVYKAGIGNCYSVIYKKKVDIEVGDLIIFNQNN